MNTSKKCRKNHQKFKRREKLSKGRRVPFTLANSPRKYPGFKNKYCYKSNIHNLIYKGSNFKNVKFQASHITNCNFSYSNLVGIDFYNTNLKKSSFKNATLNNVTFFNCNLKSTDFRGCSFENVTFMSTNIKVAKCIDSSNYNISIINSYPNLQLNNDLSLVIKELSNTNSIHKPGILHSKKNKPNFWNIYLLQKRYSKDLTRALKALKRRKDKRGFYTLHSYYEYIDNYLKKG